MVAGQVDSALARGLASLCAVLASLSVDGCRTTCDASMDRCDGNEIVRCECEGISCSSAIVETCGGDTVCREHGRQAVCVLADGTCPPEHREAGQYCEDNSVKTCFGEHLLSSTPCNPDAPCVDDEGGARCVDWVAPCVPASVLCEAERAFRICIWGRWGPRDFCPEGSTCDATQPAAPCVPSQDAGASSEIDGG